MEGWVRLVSTWQATLEAIARLGGEPVFEFALTDGTISRKRAWGLNVEPPARAEDVERVEASLGVHLPAALSRFFLEGARSIDLWWSLPEEFHLPSPFAGIFSGGFSLSLSTLQEQEMCRQNWVEQCFPNANDPYDAVWHKKLAAIPVIDGDYIAIDLREGHLGEVVYLSHCDSRGHGYLLGTDFIDFLRRWAPLGCPGPEDWQWLPFTSSKTSMLEPAGEPARMWREILGLETAS